MLVKRIFPKNETLYKLQTQSGSSLFFLSLYGTLRVLDLVDLHPHWGAWMEAREMLARLCRAHWAGTREYQLLSKSVFLTRHWESWGSPRWRLTRRIWRYQWIHSVFSLYPHCFATFLYSHVFLYINILKIFCRSLFIKIIFSRPQLFLKWHGGHGSFLRFTLKVLFWINFQ